MNWCCEANETNIYIIVGSISLVNLVCLMHEIVYEAMHWCRKICLDMVQQVNQVGSPGTQHWAVLIATRTGLAT